MQYTVIGYFADNNQVWYEHVESDIDDSDIVFSLAAKQVVERNNGYITCDDVVILEAFEGELTGLGNDTAVIGSDLL